MVEEPSQGARCSLVLRRGVAGGPPFHPLHRRWLLALGLPPGARIGTTES